MSKAKIRRNSINMYNPADSTAGVALDSSTGNTSASNSSYTSDYIAIDRTKNYTVTITSSTGTIAEDATRGLCFYDSTKTYISGFAWRGRTDTTYSAPLRSTNIPSNTAYIRFTCDNGVSSVMLAPGLTAVPYEPYGEAVWGDGTSKKRIMSRNLFDKNNHYPQNNIYLKHDGTIAVLSGGSNTWTISDYIPISPNVPTYTGSGLSTGGNGTYCCVYDSNKTFLRSVLMVANQNVTITTQPGDAYVRLSIRMVNNEIDTAMFNAGAALPYEPYGEDVWVDCAVKKRIMSRNLFDYTTMVNDDWHGYITANDISYGASSWRITDYIPCDGTDFVLSKVGGNTPAICAYDENKRLITGKAYNSGGSSTKIDVFLHTSATAKFIRFSFYGDTDDPSSYIDPSTLMLSEGTAALPTEPYGEEIWV